MSLRLLAVLALLLTCLTARSATAAEAKRAFFTGYAGTLAPRAEDKAGTYFGKDAVRGVIYRLEQGPESRAEAERLLQGSGASVDDLVRVKLVRVDGDQLRLAFAYFTAQDMARVHAAAAKRVPGLVALYRAHAADFEALFRRYRVRSVDRKVLAFDLIAGVGLNWDGLDLLDAGGWRRPVLVEGQGWRYSFFASEDTPDYSYKDFFWGSSAFPAGGVNLDPPLDFAFASFGDPYSDPRMNLPDILGVPADQLSSAVRPSAQALGFHDDERFGLKNAIGVDRARDLGPILFALRGGPRSRAALSPLVRDQKRLDAELGLLEAIGYAGRDSRGRYELLVPVLDRTDAPMLAATLKLNRKILAEWLRENDKDLRADLGDLTAMRQGVPYEALFTQIWHELFGLATRELVASGQLADPYAPGNPSPGSLGIAWRTSIYQHRWR